MTHVLIRAWPSVVQVCQSKATETILTETTSTGSPRRTGPAGHRAPTPARHHRRCRQGRTVLASPQSPWVTGIVMDLAGGGALRSVATSPTSNRAAGSVPRRTCRGPRLPHGHGDCARVSRDRLTATSYATLLDSPRRSGCSLQIRGGWSMRPVRPSRQEPGGARREPVPPTSTVRSLDRHRLRGVLASQVQEGERAALAVSV